MGFQIWLHSFQPLAQGINAIAMHGLMHQNIGALGEVCQWGEIASVPGKHDGFVGGFEFVSEAMFDRWVRYTQRRDLNRLILKDKPFINFCGCDHLANIGLFFVSHASFDVKGIRSKKAINQSVKALWAIDID